MNKIFFMPKWSRLVRKISGPDFKWHLKTGQKKCPKSDHSNTGQSGIRMPTVQREVIGMALVLCLGIKAKKSTVYKEMYIDHLNTRLVRYLNGPFQLETDNLKPNQSKATHICPVFKWSISQDHLRYEKKS